MKTHVGPLGEERMGGDRGPKIRDRRGGDGVYPENHVRVAEPQGGDPHLAGPERTS